MRKLKNLFVKERIVSQDIAKGIAIFLVMTVHTVQVNSVIGSIIGVLFGYIMPFFLFMAGYNYNDKGLDVKTNLKRRTWQLLRPFLVFSFAIFIVMGSYFYIRGEATIMEIVKSYLYFLLSKWGLPYIGVEFNQILFQRLLGPCWFIQFLIIANLIFIPSRAYTKNEENKTISVVLLLSAISALLIHFKVVLPWGIQDAPAIAGLMLIASYIKENLLLFNKKSKTGWIVLNCIVCVLVIALTQLNHSGAGFFGAGELGNVLGGREVIVFYIMAIVGSYLLVNICKLLEDVEPIKKFFCFLGKNSMMILMVHMSIVHIVKDMFKLEQRNAASSLFGDHTDPKEVIAFIVVVILVSLFVMGYNKIFNKKEKEIKDLNMN